MIGRARSYIIYNYFKYILIILLIFVGLIWLSQIIRILEFQYSISNQILDIASTTLLALPSFINPLVPFLIIIGSFMLNSKIKNSNEIIILNEKNGKPFIKLTENTKKNVEKKFKKKNYKISLSLTDEDEYAVAFVTISI